MSGDLRHTHYLLTVEIVWFKALTTLKKHLLQINNNYNTPVQMHVQAIGTPDKTDNQEGIMGWGEGTKG